MLEEAEAYKCLAASISETDREDRVVLEHVLGRVSASTVRSTMPMPRFANAMVDGYALPKGRHEVGAGFRVIGEQPAGVDLELAVSEGEAVRIFTGAPLPKGTGAVIMQEVVRVLGDDRVEIEDAIVPGRGFREAGDDLCEGQTILSPGDILTSQRMALLASQGCGEVVVKPQIRAHVISTGDELKAVGDLLAPGELYESNAVMLCAMGAEQGFPGWTRGHVVDNPASLRQAIASAVGENDFLFLSGGVSVGDHDHVRGVLRDLGMREHFWRVRVQPGKPVLVGTLGDCHVLGLPGNPVSSFVSFHLFAVPALRSWLGLPAPARLRAVLKRPAKNDANRPHYLRGHLDLVARTFDLVGLQKSHGMLGLSKASALARVPAETHLSAGDEVEVLPV